MGYWYTAGTTARECVGRQGRRQARPDTQLALHTKPPRRTELVELLRDDAEVEVAEGLAQRVLPDLLERGHDGADVGAGRQETQLDEVAGHLLVVLVHGVHHGIDQDLPGTEGARRCSSS